ncbi:hypothetical protein [Azohydromonas lata]|uniref:hypothetical protein n=1 Tax=Azohydromonas lata TaxID=45677 RepID=UPI00082F7D78|nr:hypothetical protein [Azohydromonas lata]
MSAGSTRIPGRRPEPSAVEDLRAKADSALWQAVRRSEDAHYVLAYKVASLLAVCEVATKAVHALSSLDAAASLDKPLRARLNSIEPEWAGAIADESTPYHIGQCLLVARDMCAEVAGELQTLTDQATAARRALSDGGGRAAHAPAGSDGQA